MAPASTRGDLEHKDIDLVGYFRHLLAHSLGTVRALNRPILARRVALPVSEVKERDAADVRLRVNP
jgi:hypothetical protein